jgi:two-component system cell cycle sensor histidine kinase PleC
VKRPDGAFLMIEERALASGGFITMVSDRTERRRDELLLASVQHEQRQLARQYHAEKLKAEAANRSKTAFLAHLSHDIRTPLNHIIGFAELIRHQTYGPIGDARYLNYVDTIKGSGERLLGFFASIMDLAELESGQKELHLERVEIDELLETVGRRFKPQAGRAGVSLRLGVASGAVLTADRFCLERMLGNVVENALRFTPSGGRVSLAAYAASDGVVLEIADTGIGMSEERLAELSQPFGFSDASLTREQGGAGLGLPIARAIAEQSGGNLAIDSRPGLGTTVAISLPLAEGASLPPRVKAA